MGLPVHSPLFNYRTDLLFLLVGTNPLPNYVAARLLAKERGCVYLLHTESGNSTMEVAVQLQRKIEQTSPSLKVVLSGIHDSDGEKIRARVDEILSETAPAQKLVGLNYTGGTKPMALHTYHLIRERFPNGCFSYLDPRSQKMFIHRGDGRMQTVPVGRQVEISLEELLDLHGYKLPESPPRSIPKQPELCRAITHLHSTPAGFKAWRDWLKTLKNDDPNLLASLPNGPMFGPLSQSLSDLCRGLTPSGCEVGKRLGYKGLESCAKFLLGEFLEEHTLDALTRISNEMGIIHYGVDMHPWKRGAKGAVLEMNLDVAAMFGYQLFAISCMATDAVQKAKDHLMEVFVRARQLGGDEARFALVCCLPNPEALQQEVEQTWDAEGKIRVFGRPHLLDLPNHLRNWLETANREG